MSIDDISRLVSDGVSDSDIARKLVDGGFETSQENARKAVGFLRRRLETGHAPNLVDKASLSQDYTKGEAQETFTVDSPPTTLADALRNSQADLEVWQVDKWVWNHWAGRYQVKVFFKRKTQEAGAAIESLLKEISDEFAKQSPRKSSGSGVGVVAMADFHYGMDYKGDAKNRPFTIASLTESIQTAVQKINELGLEEVHLTLLGDFIESFTGLNHTDTWKHLSSFGRTAIRGVAQLLRDELILKINNVSTIYIVAGNHDRISQKADLDSMGEGAGLIADFLELMVDVPIVFDYSYLNPDIDGVKYILSHGHLGMSKKDEYAMILEYGDQALYNVLMSGHFHSREVKKGRKVVRHLATNVVSLEGSNFRKITVPPMVSGGAYSSSIGGYSTCGVTVIRNNGAGGVDHLDLSV